MSRLDEIAAQLRAARIEAGISQQALGFRIGVVKLTVQTWEWRRRTPRLYAARAWFAALGVEFPADAAGLFRPDPKGCGYRSGYQRHRRRNERCQVCWAANAAYQRNWKSLRRAG